MLEVSREEVTASLSEVEDRCSTVEKALLGEYQVNEKRDESVAELERKVELLEQKLEKIVVTEEGREKKVNALDAASSKQYSKTAEQFSELKQKLEKMEDEKDFAMKDGDRLREQLAVLTKDQMELSLNLLVVVETCQQSEVNMMRVEQRNLELQKEVELLKEELLADSCEAGSIGNDLDLDLDSSSADYALAQQIVQSPPPPPVGYHGHLMCPPPPQLMCPLPTFSRPDPSYLPRGIQLFNPPVYFSSYGQ